jgi:O-antigen/teichoic acid export membrane protein
MIRDLLRFRGKLVRVGTPALVSRGSMALWGIFTILIVRALPPEAYAAYAVARSLQLFGMLLGGGFVMQAVTKFIAEADTDREKRYTNAAIVLTFGVAVPFAAGVVAMTGPLQAFYSDLDLRGIPWAIALVILTNATANLPHSILMARHRLVRMMIADVASVVVRVGVVGYFLLTGSLSSPLQIFSAMILGALASTVLGAAFAWRHIEPALGFERRQLVQLFGFGVVTLGSGLASRIYARTDILLLGKMAAESEVSGYSACRTLTSMATTISEAAKMVMLPLLSRMWAAGRRSEIMQRIRGAILIVSLIQLPLVLAFAVFPRSVLNYLYDGKYDAAAPVLLILGLLMVLRPFGGLFSCASAAVGKPSYALYSVVTSAAANLGLNLLLIPRYGAVGAALATAASVLAGGIAVMLLVMRKLRRPLKTGSGP